MFKIAALLAALCFSAPPIQNEDRDLLPKNKTLKKQADYVAAEPNVRKCVAWLEETPVDWKKQTHTEVTAFLMAWMEGSKDVHVNVSGDYVDIKNNFTLLIIYMGESSLYDLDHPGAPNPAQSALQGIRAMIKVYNKGQGVVTDPKIENLKAMEAKGTLDAYVTDKFAGKKKKH